jgi:hypothetical protein
MYESMLIHRPFSPNCLNQEKQPSTKTQGRKCARSKTTVPLPQEQQERRHLDLTRLNRPHQTSKDSNSPHADIEMQHSRDMTNTSHQIGNTVTLRSQGICSVKSKYVLYAF